MIAWFSLITSLPHANPFHTCIKLTLATRSAGYETTPYTRLSICVPLLTQSKCEGNKVHLWQSSILGHTTANMKVLWDWAIKNIWLFLVGWFLNLQFYIPQQQIIQFLTNPLCAIPDKHRTKAESRIITDENFTLWCHWCWCSSVILSWINTNILNTLWCQVKHTTENDKTTGTTENDKTTDTTENDKTTDYLKLSEQQINCQQ